MERTHASIMRRRRWLRLLRPFTVRPRLVAGAVAGLVVYLFLPQSLRPGTRGLIGWDGGIVLFLILTTIAMAKADQATIHRRAVQHDEGRNFILLLTIGAAIASVTVIATELAGAKGEGTKLALIHIGFTLATIILSWAFVQMIFALHYAHGYYAPKRGTRTDAKGGLAFPGDEPPDYWDFLHFAIVIGVAAQTADIAIRSKEMRRVATVHSLVAFAFNTAILAMMVNLAAGLF
jgi:uncharacterized membrane protein